MIGVPTSLCEVITDSGWNWTAAIGRSTCSIAMTIRSSVSAVTESAGGKLALRAYSEW